MVGTSANSTGAGAAACAGSAQGAGGAGTDSTEPMDCASGGAAVAACGDDVCWCGAPAAGVAHGRCRARGA
eukprot:3934669-Rhodomonas_salina.1